ncbi:MAG: aspartate/glutamate racemase family protein [Clostridiales Family XIII bacterium]|jgi:Asp/Glu/hydantoin racemase|nr:aspartate/glutamate racemase family protein [Clostridiales Family XIII bacterium]
MKQDMDREYGYLHQGNDAHFVRGVPRQQVAGFSVGIVYIENIDYTLMPGNVVNACTYDFPVRMRAVENLTNTRLFEADPTIMDDILAAARHMVEKEGVRAICSACGFFGNYHRQVAAALDVPVALSSLVQIPMIQATLAPGRKVGILTANAAAMTDALYANCGIADTGGLVVEDTLDTEQFSAVVKMTGGFDNGAARQEVVGAARKLVARDPDIGAILLECSDMPPYAAVIQAETGLPVFDFITLIRWMHDAVAQRPYAGWV